MTRLSTTMAVLTFASAAGPALAEHLSLDGLKDRIVGSWTSITCELRPAPNPNDPSLAPVESFLTRDFTYNADDTYSANITVYADPSCEIPAAAYDFAGDLVWHGENPAAPGAWSQDYVLNSALTITALAPPFVDQMNALPDGACGEGAFALGEPKDILGQPCVLLNFVEGSDFVIDHDFLYVREDTPNMLFMGGKHVDGTGFYYPENRPEVGLQQPLIRVN